MTRQALAVGLMLLVTSMTMEARVQTAELAGRLPVVVLMHGSGGMRPGIDSWSREFNAMGVSTFAFDGFTGRGDPHLAAQATIGEFTRTLFGLKP